MGTTSYRFGGRFRPSESGSREGQGCHPRADEVATPPISEFGSEILFREIRSSGYVVALYLLAIFGPKNSFSAENFADTAVRSGYIRPPIRQETLTKSPLFFSFFLVGIASDVFRRGKEASKYRNLKILQSVNLHINSRFMDQYSYSHTLPPHQPHPRFHPLTNSVPPFRPKLPLCRNPPLTNPPLLRPWELVGILRFITFSPLLITLPHKPFSPSYHSSR